MHSRFAWLMVSLSSLAISSAFFGFAKRKP